MYEVQMSCEESFVLDHAALTEADVRRAMDVKQTPLMMAEAYKVGLQTVREFVKWCVTPSLQTLVLPSDHETALVVLFNRIQLLIETLLVLTDGRHFQSIMGASRTAVELYVDMHLIDRQLIQDAVEKFFVFRRAQQLKAARRMIDFYAANPALRTRSLDVFRDFVTINGQAIDADTTRLWGGGRRPVTPQHWSDRDLISRGRLVGVDVNQLVVEGYDYRNWLLHSGAAGVANMDLATFIAFSASALHAVHSVAIGAISLLARRVNLAATIPDLQMRIEGLETTPGFILTDLRLRSLGEPQRVRVRFQQSGSV